MRTYTTPAQDAADIRRCIRRELGLTSCQVSVRSHSYSMGSSVDLQVKTPEAAAHFAHIREIARKVAEYIRRDQYTGDILSGCNRYVSVELAPSAFAPLVERYGEAVREAVAAVDALPTDDSSGTLFPIGKTTLLLGRSNYGHGYDVHSDSDSPRSCFNADAVLDFMARRLATHPEETTREKVQP